MKATGRVQAVFWCLIAPIGFAVLVFIFSQGQNPGSHAQPQPFSCVREIQESSVLGDGASIAPLCGQEATP